MSNLALAVKGLQKKFGQSESIFHNLDIEVKKGEFVAVIGPNGSGKTTLIRIILGLETPTTGEIHLYEDKVGYVPQRINRDAYSSMTVNELLLLKMRKLPFWFGRKKTEAQITSLLKQTNTTHLLHKQLKNLSGGELQRVMISYALADNPGLLILDEPVSGVDVHGEQDFYNLLETIHQSRDITIMMISHDIDIVYQRASQVICLNRELICQGVPKDVLNKETIEKTFTTKHGVYHHQHHAKTDV
jgi:zinc transport system ATP-binding protein